MHRIRPCLLKNPGVLKSTVDFLRQVGHTHTLQKAKAMDPATIQRMTEKANEADQIIEYLRSQLVKVQKEQAEKTMRAEEERLRKENAVLKNELNKMKTLLVQEEMRNGVRQIGVPAKASQSAPAPVPCAAPVKQEATVKAAPPKKEGKAKPAKKGGGKAPPAAPEGPIDVSRLNMKVGLIESAEKHPDADGLYVEKVNLGEERTRTIISGLVKHVPLEKMQNRLAVFLCNLKPAKMRGIMSEGMIMCGSTPEKVEIIDVPEGAQIGDRVIVEGYEGEPDGLLNPKKKVWEQVQPDLKINEQGMATYKGALWKLEGKGHFMAPTLRGTPIK